MKLEWSIGQSFEVAGMRVDGRTRLGKRLKLFHTARAYRLSMKDSQGKDRFVLGVVANELPRHLVADMIWKDRQFLKAGVKP